MRNFLKNWGALAIAIFALVASVYAIYIDNEHLKLQKASDQSLDEQHKQAVVRQEERNNVLDAQFRESMKTASEALETDREHYNESMKTANEVLEADLEHYEYLKKRFDDIVDPHIRHEEILHYIKFLEDRLDRYWNWISPLSGYQGEVGEAYYMKDAGNCESAKSHLMASNFNLAEQLVKAADANLDEGYLAVVSSNTTAKMP